MKNILIIILLGLVGFLGYSYLQKTDSNVTSLTSTDQGAIVIENTPAETNKPAGSSTAEEPEDLASTPLSATTTTTTYCETLKQNVSGSASYVIMTSLGGGTTISNGDTLSGCVYAPNGTYAGWGPFEGQVGSYVVTASDGTTLGQGPLPVVETLNWQTLAIALEDIEYSTAMDFDPTGHTSGTVTLQNENASGEPTNDKTVVINVNF